MDDDFNPYEWHVGDPEDWADGQAGVPDIPYMGYINNNGDEYTSPRGRVMSKDEELAKKAFEMQKDGFYEQAKLLIDRAIVINPNVSNHWNIKAIILDNSGEYEEALKYYDKSLSMKNDIVVKGNKAQCLYRFANAMNYGGNHEQALKLVNEALATLPDDDGRSDYLNLKGRLLDSLGYSVQSKKCFLLASGMIDELDELESQIKILENSTDTLINIAGRKFHTDHAPLTAGTVVDLIAEPENEHDKDAIRIELDSKTVGYVANSPYTLLDCIKSATEIKFKLKSNQKAKILFPFLDNYLIAKLI